MCLEEVKRPQLLHQAVARRASVVVYVPLVSPFDGQVLCWQTLTGG